MKISIFGLGYVGAVTAGCLTSHDHYVVGVDVHDGKVADFNKGVPPIVEPGLEDLLKRAKERQLLRATTDCDDAIADTELSIVCVGTPSAPSGALDLSYVRMVAGQIGEAVKKKGTPHVLVFRSTMLPGSTEAIVAEKLADLESGDLLSVFYYPEFLRESTAVADFEEPSLAVVGSRDGSRPSESLMAALFGESAAVVNWPTAEMVKYACNAFHAAKITFANEIGRVGKQMKIDAKSVMNLLCQDTRLNISSYYMRPGNPFGGSCLPKDVRALTNKARSAGVNVPMLDSLLGSNDQHLRSLLSLVEATGQREAVILGLSFKSNTDDLRESPMVDVAQYLLGHGLTLRIYDPALNLSALVGANKRVIDVRMPHLAQLLQADLGSALGSKGVVIAAQKCAGIAELAAHITDHHHVIDVNGWTELRELPSHYQGFCW
ncbi:MAG: UDP-glucose/GDP-mannose dehydrogenase family protein [Verrucomicrobiae bacterium]|jgi:GDP-mannose 6-dehydrogenase|nr:UDP-glucose/GDP-mannose dehydrogenase family protein [Verrucomicrobiae bacterium]